MSQENMVVIVTGANRGIGLAICELILKTNSNVKLYAASRAGADLGLKSAGSGSIKYPKLDVTKDQDIKQLAEDIKREEGQISVLINNAGVNTYPEHTPESVKQMLDVNYRGTYDMCKTFIPLLSKTGRIVNMSSTGSQLKIYSKHNATRFRNTETYEDVEKIADDYMQAVKEKKELASGFGDKGQGYSVSKACVNAITAILARENPGLIINACCPGWVDTDMGGIMGKPPKEPIEGAKIPVKLGFGDISGTTGRYWANPGIADKGDGQVLAW
ncbi:NAD(P)-binding protein [Aureobasidium sp. EXF-12298]|nr:NAD(P)-binding protein [Aureobasidium sp. EXF-12298]